MSGLQRIVRHPDRRADPHARATMLASDSLLEPLLAPDAAWLDEHLANCPDCRHMAETFAADAALLGGLRGAFPPAPRDLTARLSSALDREMPRAVARQRRSGMLRRAARQPRLALAGLTVAAVVAIIALPLVMSSTVAPAASPGSVALATPIPVTSNTVAWVSRNADGSLTLSAANVDHVCPASDASVCGTLSGTSEALLPLTMNLDSVLLAPSGQGAVVIGGDGVFAVNVSTSVTRPSPRPSPTTTFGAPSPTPTVAGVSTSPPVGTPVPSGSPSAAASAAASASPSSAVASSSAVPSPSSSAVGSQRPSGSPPSPSPSDASALPSPTPTASPSPTASPVPTASADASSSPYAGSSALPSGPLASGTPAPSAAAHYSLAAGVVLVGATASYSPDGRWVAFSARPKDGSHGPDLYVWAVGEDTARVVTTNHATIFSGWLDDRILVSIPVVAPAAAGPSPDASASSAEPSPNASASSAEPSPDASASSPDASPSAAGSSASTTAPPGDRALATQRAAALQASAAASTVPAATDDQKGGLVPAPATADPATVVARSFIVDPASGAAQPIAATNIWRPVVNPTGRMVVYWSGHFAWNKAQSAWVPASGSLVTAGWRVVRDQAAVPDSQPVLNGASAGSILAWDVRFDPAGRHLAVWVTDRAVVSGSSVGRLSLFGIGSDGSLSDALYSDTSLPGYSLGADRLAWATPPGENGEGSMVAVFAWTANGGGRVDTKPASGSDPVVVAH